MKVLMFGWEFPPHILGGLGTASYGITKGLAEQGDMDITLCLPNPHGDEDRSFLNIIPMNNVPVVWRDVSRDYVESRIGQRLSPDLYYDLRSHIYADFSYRYTDDLGCINFSGRYPDNLTEEINNYSIVAGVIARQQQFDIIHAQRLQFLISLEQDVVAFAIVIVSQTTETERTVFPATSCLVVEESGIDGIGKTLPTISLAIVAGNVINQFF